MINLCGCGCGRPTKRATRTQRGYSTGDRLRFVKGHSFRFRPPEDRFWVKVDRTPVGCWAWSGYVAKSGYGHFGMGGKRGPVLDAHRVAWTLTSGAVPNGLQVLHKCDNRRCVRPSHLFLGTQRDNIDDMVSKGRQKGGPNSPARIMEKRGES